MFKISQSTPRYQWSQMEWSLCSNWLPRQVRLCYSWRWMWQWCFVWYLSRQPVYLWSILLGCWVLQSSKTKQKYFWKELLRCSFVATVSHFQMNGKSLPIAPMLEIAWPGILTLQPIVQASPLQFHGNGVEFVFHWIVMKTVQLLVMNVKMDHCQVLAKTTSVPMIHFCSLQLVSLHLLLKVKSSLLVQNWFIHRGHFLLRNWWFK